jgi:hypothetical protein
MVGGRDDAVARKIASEGANGPWLLDCAEAEVRERTHGAHRIYDRQTGLPANWASFEGQLDVELAWFCGLTPRRAYQHLLAYYLLPVVGSGEVASWSVHRIMMYAELQEHHRVPPERRVRAVVLSHCAGPLVPVLRDALAEAFGAENVSEVDGDVTVDGVRAARPDLFIEQVERPPLIVATEVPR